MTFGNHFGGDIWAKPGNFKWDEFEMFSPKKLVDESETWIDICQLFRGINGITFVEVK